MKKLLFTFLSVALMSLAIQGQVLQKRQVALMGSRFEITVVANDTLQAQSFIDRAVEEIDRIEHLISEWKPTSQISEVNQNAGIRPVRVDKEVFDLVNRSLYFSSVTDGAFDISIVAMDKIWKFDGSMDTLPHPDQIKNAIRNVGYQYIVLDSIQNTIFLTRPGMKIGLGATGKGYAADQGRSLLQSLGVMSGIVNASGDLSTWGRPLKGCHWKVGVNDPFRPFTTADILKMRKGAVTTSGDYQKYIEVEGVRYSHIIHPKTGMPSQGLTSVTVIGPSAEFANGLSTSIMVLGLEEGLKLIANYPEYATLIITNDGEKITSKNYKSVKRNLRKD